VRSRADLDAVAKIMFLRFDGILPHDCTALHLRRQRLENVHFFFCVCETEDIRKTSSIFHLVSDAKFLLHNTQNFALLFFGDQFIV